MSTPTPMKRTPHLSLFVLAAMACTGRAARADSYTYTTITDPADATLTEATDVNNADQVVGWYYNNSGYHGFVDTNGSFADVNDPSSSTGGASGTFVDGINNVGQIVGSYNNTVGSGFHSFIDTNGAFTTLDDPAGTTGSGQGYTYAQAINDSGQVVGWYGTSGVSGAHGFLYSNGVYTNISDPLANNGTVATGINNAGQISGYYYIGNTAYGFVDTNGSFVTTPFYGSWQNRINNLGQISGEEGVYTGTSYSSVYDTLGTSGSWDAGLNDHGDVVGYYEIGSTNYGFLATDDSSGQSVPEPASLAMLGVGLSLLGFSVTLRKSRQDLLFCKKAAKNFGPAVAESWIKVFWSFS